ncbi:MAG: hypothetical protein JXX29_13045 [Deltaproteobacteria bacterium]|nr:hypothetical protein [Deltaproteobacteria bacterium]MBN2672604.1 hypothetical protein [Deltaproteobacteria bacterium]
MTKKLFILSLLASCFLASPMVTAQDDFNPNFVAPRSKVAPGLGQDPSELAVKTYGVNPIALDGGGGDADERNNFYYTGYFRAPFNFGIGSNETLEGDGLSGTKIHSLPVIPDTSYLDWRYTNTHGGPWAEIKFTYGNRKVSGNVALATYNMTTGGYKKLASQLGITEGFVSMNFPGIFADRGGLVANVGVFSARYGMAGRYDAGSYDTYLFGATKTAGEHMRVYFDIAPKLTLHLEQGFGGKVEVAPFAQYELVDMDGETVTNSANNDQVVPNPLGGQQWTPYGGSDWEQGDTLLHHEHIGVTYDDKLFIGGHFMHSFSKDSDSFNEDFGSAKNAHLMNMGVDVRLRDFFFGNGYLGYSHIDLKNPLRLGGALEALHSAGGWAWNQNYFKPSTISPTGGGSHMTATNMGDNTGTIDTIVFEYEFSVAKFLWHPKAFWGQDKDVVIKAFGMLNFVNSDSPLFTAATTKLKYGGDVLWTPMPWFGLGGRVDIVNPDMDDNTVSFVQYSGRMLFRSKFVTHETINVQYTYYDLGENVMSGYPWNVDGPNGPMKCDEHVISLGASMWW